MIICTCHPPAPQTDDFVKNLIVLVSPIVVIILFIIDRIIAHVLRQQEVERNWYLKIMIEPGIAKISTFYKSAKETYASSSYELAYVDIGTISHANYLSMQSKEISKFQLIKRDLEGEVFYPIKSLYPKVFDLLTNELLDLEDLYTANIDNKLFNDEQITNFNLRLNQSKVKIIAVLYSPLLKK